MSGCRIEFRRSRRRASPKTSSPSRARSSVPSALKTSAPNSSTTARSPCAPGSTTRRASSSASTTRQPSPASTPDTKDFPVAIEPVSPTRNISIEGQKGKWEKGERAGAIRKKFYPFALLTFFPLSPFCYPAPPARGGDGVLHQHGDREQADAAGHGRQAARHAPDLRRVHVARERVAALAQGLQPPFGVFAEKLAHQRLVRHAVHPDVDDGRARPHVLAAYEARAPDRRDEYVGLPRHRRQVARARVADGHGRVALEEQLRHGPADDVASPDDDGPRAGDFDPLAHEQLDYAGGRARQKGGAPEHHPADVDRREPVHVLRRVNRLDDRRLVHARGQGQLYEYAVNVLARVAGGDQFEQLFGRRLRRERVVF